MQKEGKYSSLHRTCSKLLSQLAVLWFMACVFDLANFNLLCQSLCREKVTSVFIFLSLHDYSPLKVIKYCKLHKSGEKGREPEMRGKAHLHLYLKWQMQMDQMIWQEGNVNSSLQLFADRKKIIFLLDRPFYISRKCHSIRHLINHHGSILKFRMIFSNCSEQRLVCFVWDFTCLAAAKEWLSVAG